MKGMFSNVLLFFVATLQIYVIISLFEGSPYLSAWNHYSVWALTVFVWVSSYFTIKAYRSE